MGITLDTSVLIDLLRGDRRTQALLEGLEREGLLSTLSTVAVFEALSGVEFTKSRADRVRLELLLRQIPLEGFDLDAARKAGELRAELLRAGKSPGAPDVMIAGQALAAGHTLVTRDRFLAASARAMGVQVVDY
ncbi:MAG: type II toxin-antitoxin system VapC family toxin [Thermoplasmata archaeon]